MSANRPVQIEVPPRAGVIGIWIFRSRACEETKVWVNGQLWVSLENMGVLFPGGMILHNRVLVHIFLQLKDEPVRKFNFFPF